MDLAPEQYFVYAWRYTDDTVCKLCILQYFCEFRTFFDEFCVYFARKRNIL